MSPKPRRLAVDVYGYGQVARALLPMLKRAEIGIATVRDRTRIRISHPARGGRRVFVDATSPRYDGEPARAWVRRLEAALSGGTPVVTCNKAPLAIAWKRLVVAARAGRTSLSCSATVGGGTPVLLFLHRLHRSHGVVRVEAPLNATTNFVLDRVANGASLPDAVRAAHRAGWAESDPTLDLDGTDAQAKAVIIHNLLFPEKRPLALLPSRPRLRLKEEEIRHLATSSGAPRLIATIVPSRVRLKLLAGSAAKAIPGGLGVAGARAVLRDGSEATITGPGAGPQVTAGALVGDLLALRDSFDEVGIRP